MSLEMDEDGLAVPLDEEEDEVDLKDVLSCMAHSLEKLALASERKEELFVKHVVNRQIQTVDASSFATAQQVAQLTTIIKMLEGRVRDLEKDLKEGLESANFKFNLLSHKVSVLQQLVTKHEEAAKAREASNLEIQRIGAELKEQLAKTKAEMNASFSGKLSDESIAALGRIKAEMTHPRKPVISDETI